MADPLPSISIEYNSAQFDEAARYQPTIPSTTTLNTVANTPASLITDIDKATRSISLDILRDYDWTLSTNKRSIINTIPYITLVENKLVSSNILTSLFASIFTLPDAINTNNASLDYIRNGFTNITNLSPYESARDKLTGLLPDGIIRDKIAASTFTDVLNSIRAGSSYASSKINDIYNTLRSHYSKPTNNFRGKLYDIYGLLYLTKPTGSEYIFPYFNSEFVSLDNNFKDSYQTTPGFDALADIVKNVSENTKAIPSLVEPGTYIQRPQFYNFESGTATINFKVTLFNTINTNSYLKNSELISKLLLLNMPRRVNKILVDPPCIYEVTIPGRAVYPYCYIKGLTVNHEGVKRIIPIDGVDRIVPDAFTINFSIKSLINEVNNLYEPQAGSAGVNLDSRETLDITSMTASSYRENVLKNTNMQN